MGFPMVYGLHGKGGVVGKSGWVCLGGFLSFLRHADLDLSFFEPKHRKQERRDFTFQHLENTKHHPVSRVQ